MVHFIKTLKNTWKNGLVVNGYITEQLSKSATVITTKTTEHSTFKMTLEKFFNIIIILLHVYRNTESEKSSPKLKALLLNFVIFGTYIS